MNPISHFARMRARLIPRLFKTNQPAPLQPADYLEGLKRNRGDHNENQSTGGIHSACLCRAGSGAT
jgi:hypothetical protein